MPPELTKPKSNPKASLSKSENEFCSWMLLNGDDLFPPFEPQQTQTIDTILDLPDVTSKRDSNPEKKREERLIRNREIAKNCRKRKRERIEAMEKELQQLRNEKKELENKVENFQKLHMADKKKADDTLRLKSDMVDLKIAEFKEIHRLVAEYDNLSGEEDNQSLMTVEERREKLISELEAKLGCCRDLHSDFGDARETEIKFHMEQLKKLLLPSQLRKVTMWSLQQEDEFYDEQNNSKKFGGGLWNTLCNEFKLNEEQKSGLIKMRKSIRRQRENIDECVKILKELDSRVSNNFQAMKSQMTEIMRITTPIQQGKFLKWIDENQACMYMVNKMWEKKNTKPIKVEAEKKSEEKILPSPSPKLSSAAMEEALKSGETLMAMQALIKKRSQN